MRKALLFIAAVQAIAIDAVVLVGGVVLSVYRTPWYAGLSVAAALAPCVAAWFYHCHLLALEEMARAAGNPFAGVEGILRRRVRTARHVARSAPLPRHLMVLPVLRCSTPARRRVA